MAVETPDAYIQEEDLEAVRQEEESLASELTQEDADAAERLKAEEFTGREEFVNSEEQPFGSRKDNTLLIDDSQGEAPLLEEQGREEIQQGENTDTPSPLAEETGAAPADLTPGSGFEAQTAQQGGRRIATDINQEAPEDGRTTPSGVLDTSGAPEEQSANAPSTPEEPETPISTPETPGGDTPEIVAQSPSLSLTPATGYEDGVISLDIQASTNDTDNGNETLTIQISGVPDGVTLSAGVDLGDGVWQLTQEDLEGLTLTLPENSNEDFNLNVMATSRESNGSTASSSSVLAVDVIGVADTPELTASLDSGSEDSSVALNISGELTDTDGSETLTFVVEDMPEGATLSAGTDNGDGTWSLTTDDLDGLQFNPPENYSGEVNLTVIAVSTENDGDTASVSTDVSATFTPVADDPTLSAQDVAGNEDTSISLDISAALTDSTETLSVTIDGVPNGATLNHGTDNGDGTWTVNPNDLDDVALTPAEDYSGDISLTVTATSTESDGSQAVNTTDFNVHVTGVADDPTLTAGASTGDEDTAVSLDLSAALNDVDGSETLSVTISDVPDGFTLSAGTDIGDGTWTLTADDLDGLTMEGPEDYSGSFSLGVTATATEADGDTASTSATLPVTFTAVADNPTLSINDAATDEDTTVSLSIETGVTDASETITGVVIDGVPEGATLNHGTDNGDGSWSLSAEDLEGLTLTPTADSNVDFTLTVTSTSQDVNGDTATTTSSLDVTVTGVSDTPDLEVEDASGRENTWIKLSVDGALADTDGSETLTYEISGLPDGAKLNVGTQSADGTWHIDADDVDNLYILPPSNYSGTFELETTVISTENDGDSSSVSATIDVTVDAVADSANVHVSNVTTTEDHDLQLSLDASVRDSSEEIQGAVITGVPDGFTVEGGTDLGNGSWAVDPANLDNISLTPPEDYAGTVNLRFNVTTVEPENGSTKTTGLNFNATFTAEADAPLVTASDVTTDEDTPIHLELSAQLTDLDMSETLTITIDGVPDGATLSAGMDNGDGTWSVDPTDLDTLELTPPENFSGDISLTMTATSTEALNGDTNSVPIDFNVHVVGVADATTMAVMDALGSEDNAIPLTVRASLTDTDGSETLFVEIDGVPEGATLSAGEEQADGTWLVSGDDLATLSITPADDSNDDFTLTLRSVAVEADGDVSYSDPQTIDVTVRGVADTADVQIDGAHGYEDTAIALNFQATSTDADGSETISYVITGVPEGAELSGGVYIGNDRWSVTADEMDDMTITPPEDFSGTFNLGVTVVVQEDDGYQSTQAYTLPVTVDAVVDQPDRGGLDGSRSYGTAHGTEDTAINLNLAPGLNDVDDSEQTLWVEVSDVPDGAELSVNGVVVDSEDGVYRISPDDMGSVTITPAADSDVDFDLTIKAAIQDGDVVDYADGTLHVNVAADADAPTLEVGDISGSEGEAISTNISSVLTDTDGSENLNFIITGLEGTTIVPSEGINLGNGEFLVTGEQLENLTFSSGDINENISVDVTVNAIATENSGGDQAVTTDTFTISVEADSNHQGGGSESGGQGEEGGGSSGGDNTIDAPVVTVVSPGGDEDQPFSVSIEADFDADGVQNGIILSDLPDGAVPNMGFYNPIANTWVIAGDADLDSLEVTPPNDFAGELSFTVTVAQTGAGGLTQTDSTTVTTTIDPIVDTPRVSIGNSQGVEDTPLDLDLSVTSTDSDGSETVTSIVISDLPEGSTLLGATDLGDGRYTVDPDQSDQVQFVPPENAHGNYNFTIETTVVESDGTEATFTRGAGVTITAEVDDANISVSDASGFEDTAIELNLSASLTDTDGSETIAVTISGVPENALFSAGSNNGDGSWTFTVDELSDLTFTAPPDASGDIDLTLNAYTRDTSSGQVATTSQSFTVDVEGVADAMPVDSQDSTGLEDTAIPITLDYTQVDTDGSESITAILTGIPEGAELSAGELLADGSWEVPGDALETLTITPPENFSGDIDVHAEIVATETYGDTASSFTDFTVSVTGVADAPDLAVSDVTGNEDTAIVLNIDAALVDSSETMSITIDGVPDGAILSAGTDNGDGTWTLDPGDLTGLTITPAENDSTDFTLNVTATTVDGDSTAQSTASFTVDVTGVADTPTLSVSEVSGNEDTAIGLDIDAALVDSSETLSITIDGVPDGATLSAGTDNGDGTWALDPGDLTGLTITPAENDSTDFTLNVTATSMDDGTLAHTAASLTVDVTGVADTPILTVSDASGLEDTAISLDIHSTLTDASEHLSVTIDGVPDGALLSAGTDNGDGTWTLDQDDLHGLTITPAQDDATDFDLSVTATSTDGDSHASTVQTLSVDVGGTPDTPVFDVTDANGIEGEPVHLDIHAATVGMDETMSITIDGVPDGATLSAGTANEDGSWTLDSDDLDGLQVTTPEDYSGHFQLEVGVDVMQDGNTLSVTESLDVTVATADPQSGSDDPYLSMLQASGSQHGAMPSFSGEAQGYMDTLGLQDQPSGADDAALAQNMDHVFNMQPDAHDSLDASLQHSHDPQADTHDYVLPDPVGDNPNDDVDGPHGMDHLDMHHDM